MSWYSDNGFRITRDRSMDSPGNGIRFNLSVYVGNGRAIRLDLTKTDVQGIKREATKALKEQKEEQ
jgi:hypothetical protein